MVARGKRSEPLVGIGIIGSPEGAKKFDQRIFRPCRGSFILDSIPGVQLPKAAFTPGYHLSPLRGLDQM